MDGQVTLQAAGLIIGGAGSILLSILTWRAWRAGKPLPFQFLRGLKETRTEMKTIALAGEVFFEMLAGIILIWVGAVILGWF